MIVGVWIAFGHGAIDLTTGWTLLTPSTFWQTPNDLVCRGVAIVGPAGQRSGPSVWRLDGPLCGFGIPAYWDPSRCCGNLGAFFGDKDQPLSDTRTLPCGNGHERLRPHQEPCCLTTVPAMIISALVIYQSWSAFKMLIKKEGVAM